MVAYQEKRREPEASRDEAESLRSLPLPAVRAPLRDATPMEDAAAVDVVDPIDEDAEHGEPGSRHEQVERVVHHAASRRDQPDEGEEDRESRDDPGVCEVDPLRARVRALDAAVGAGPRLERGPEHADQAMQVRLVRHGGGRGGLWSHGDLSLSWSWMGW